MRFEELATDTVDDGNGCWIRYIDTLWSRPHNWSILLVKLVIFIWRFAIPDEKQAPEAGIACPCWTRDLGEGWVIDRAEEEKDEQGSEKKYQVDVVDVQHCSFRAGYSPVGEV